MFKKTVVYKDFNEKEHTEDLYFHLMSPEIADLQFNVTFESAGGLSDYIREAMKSGDGQKVYTFFKLMIVNSYGRRSDDGSRFIKKTDFTEDFLNSNAYEAFFMWLLENPKNAESFWTGIMPDSLKEKVAEIEQDNPKKALRDMTREELEAAFLAKLGAGNHAKVIDTSA